MTTREAGETAARIGLDLSDNPHQPGTEDHDAWMEGFNDHNRRFSLWLANCDKTYV